MFQNNRLINSPFDSKTSLVSLIVNGKSWGRTDRKDLSANAPWPISLLPMLVRPVSLVANGGNS